MCWDGGEFDLEGLNPWEHEWVSQSERIVVAHPWNLHNGYEVEKKRFRTRAPRWRAPGPTGCQTGAVTPEQPRQRPKILAESIMDGEVNLGAGWLKLHRKIKRQRMSQAAINWALFIFAATGAVTGILALVLR
jgi:hypothetical protein